MLLIAHRGASGHAPENTLAAFKKAVTLGATFIETDLQLTRDARLVAIHDETVNRTTNGKGAVHDMTLAELRRLIAPVLLRRTRASVALELPARTKEIIRIAPSEEQLARDGHAFVRARTS